MINKIAYPRYFRFVSLFRRRFAVVLFAVSPFCRFAVQPFSRSAVAVYCWGELVGVQVGR